MTSGLVIASFSLPERQAVKKIFFAPWHVSGDYNVKLTAGVEVERKKGFSHYLTKALDKWLPMGDDSSQKISRTWESDSKLICRKLNICLWFYLRKTLSSAWLKRHVNLWFSQTNLEATHNGWRNAYQQICPAIRWKNPKHWWKGDIIHNHQPWKE